MPPTRGAVYKASIQVTGPGGAGTGSAEKYIVLLQDPGQMDPNATNIAFVIASTDRTDARTPREFEVRLGPADGFSRSTIVDGRWVYTERRSDLLDRAIYVTQLSEERMYAVSLAVFVGLQLDP